MRITRLGGGQNNGRSPFAKMEKPQRTSSVEKVSGKKLPAKREEIQSKPPNEVGVNRDVELADTTETAKADYSSDVDLEYEYDFEVKNKNKYIIEDKQIITM